jgi:hypothetical protein
MLSVAMPSAVAPTAVTPTAVASFRRLSNGPLIELPFLMTVIGSSSSLSTIKTRNLNIPQGACITKLFTAAFNSVPQ